MKVPAAVLTMLLSLGACSSGGDPIEKRSYAPCAGEPGACGLALQSSNGTCLCTYFCKTAADCPVPKTGTAMPLCKSFGDVVLNGHTADCRVPCDAETVCPDGMMCLEGECYGRVKR
jgi:hypothetical protein